MNIRLLHLLCALTLGSVTVSANEIRLNDVDHLRRLSLTTLGHAPGPAEYVELSKRDPMAREQYLRERADQYVQDDEFAAKMTSNLSFLFRVAPPRDVPGNKRQYTSLHLLFDRVMRGNATWDELLVSGTVGITKDSDFGSLDFFKNAATPDERQQLNDYLRDNKLAEAKEEYQTGNTNGSYAWMPSTAPSLKFKSPQISGVLSDPHFSARFPTNPINQNRKRAAAIFRIFLCDEMQAVTLPDTTVQNDLDAAGFESKSAAAPIEHSGDIHGNDPKCASCHYKLDPLANAFRGVSNRLPSRPGAGALTFRRRNGELVNVPFRNVRELGQALVKQPDYVSCQVRHFWDWFVGEDVIMDQRTENELTREFERVGRRPREFARYLLGRPEFTTFPNVTPETITVNHVSRTLMDCTSCHTTEKAAPDYRHIPFTRFGITVPAEKTQQLHDYNLETMIETLDLVGDGSKKTMPPQNAGWNLSSDERARLLAWLANGARDENGRETWMDSSLRSQLAERMRAEKISFAYRPTQGWTARRRMSLDNVKSSLNLILENLGITPQYDQYVPEAAISISLTTGAPIKTMASDYVSAVSQRAQNFAYALMTSISSNSEIRTRLGLKSLLIVSDEMIIRSLSRLLWGREIAPGHPDYAKLESFLKTRSQKESQVKVYDLAYQMIINDRFLVY